MLSMLRFCRAIEYRSVWYVSAVRRQGAESTSHYLEHVQFFCVWKARSANKRGGERGRLTPRRPNKNGQLSDSNVFLVCLPLLRKPQTECDGSEEKQVILALEA